MKTPLLILLLAVLAQCGRAGSVEGDQAVRVLERTIRNPECEGDWKDRALKNTITVTNEAAPCTLKLYPKTFKIPQPTKHHSSTPQLKSVKLVNGTMEVVKHYPCKDFTIYGLGSRSSPMANDIIWKEIYAAVDGQIKLVKTVEVEVVPAHTVPETVKWRE